VRLFCLAVELEGNDWIFAGGFDGRIDAKDDTNCERNAAGDTENFPRDMWGKWRNKGNQEGEDVAKRKSHDAAHNA